MFDNLRKPDFIGIGCIKAGSTWLWRQLFDHPGVMMHPGKEMRYFSQVGRIPCTPREYLERFQAFPADRKTGEVTPDYISYPHVPILIKAMCPDARLFTILRNPVDRAFSHYKLRGDPNWGIPTGMTFEEVFFGDYPKKDVPMRFCSVRQRGLYSQQLESWYEHFPREQIKVLFFDDIAENPQGLLRELYSFVGVDPDFVPPEHAMPRNVNAKTPDLKLTPDERARVGRYYAEEVTRLEKLTGRDLSRWR